MFSDILLTKLEHVHRCIGLNSTPASLLLIKKASMLLPIAIFMPSKVTYQRKPLADM